MTTMNNEDPANSSLRERCDTDAAQPVAWLYVGGTYGGELEEWEIEAEQAACDRLNEASNGVETKLPLYTADQMREAIAEERERSHELLQAADHIRAGLEAKLAALSAALAEKDQPK